jgi:hypothetical protein
MPLLNRPGIDVSHVEFFVARSQMPRDVQLCAMRFRASPRTEHRSNALIVPFPIDAPAAARAHEVVRVGDLNDGYSELFLDLSRNFLTDHDDDDDNDHSSDASSSNAVDSSSLPTVRKVAVRVCADWNELLNFREKGFRLSKTLKPILQVSQTKSSTISIGDRFLFFFCFLFFSIIIPTVMHSLSVFWISIRSLRNSSSSLHSRFRFLMRSMMLYLFRLSLVHHLLRHL